MLGGGRRRTRTRAEHQATCARDTRTMGFYGERVFPRIMNALMDTKETRRIRQRVCAPLRGEVVEIGFGTGHNLPFLPEGVTRLQAVEPLAKARDIAADRVAATGCPVEFVGLDGQYLPLDDESADAVSRPGLCAASGIPLPLSGRSSGFSDPEARSTSSSTACLPTRVCGNGRTAATIAVDGGGAAPREAVKT